MNAYLPNASVNQARLRQDLAALGIGAGDLVFFHSSLKSIGQVEDGPDAVLDAFLATLGESGTLALPALCKYDWKSTPMAEIEKIYRASPQPTFTGLIPETFRRRPRVLRSDNPTHSVTACGPLAAAITGEHSRAYGGENAVDRPVWASRGAFGPHSPWDKLYQFDAKYMFIGVDFNVCTIFHHVQVLLLIEGPAACWPKFDFRALGRQMDAAGLVRHGRLGWADTQWIGCRALVDNALRMLRQSGLPASRQADG